MMWSNIQSPVARLCQDLVLEGMVKWKHKKCYLFHWYKYTVLAGNLGPFIYYLLQSQMYICFDSANFLLGKFYVTGFLT